MYPPACRSCRGGACRASQGTIRGALPEKIFSTWGHAQPVVVPEEQSLDATENIFSNEGHARGVLF